MSQLLDPTLSCAEVFDTVAQADQAIRRLLAAGFSQEQLAVICPDKFKDHFLPEVQQTETAVDNATDKIAIGGAVGATLGGLAMVATVLTGGIGGVAAAGVFIGGGAIAGGVSSLIFSRGYDQQEDELAKQAVEQGKIVVAVLVHDENDAHRLAQARLILSETAGAKPLYPVESPAISAPESAPK